MSYNEYLVWDIVINEIPELRRHIKAIVKSKK